MELVTRSETVSKALAIGRKNHWAFRSVRLDGMIDEPFLEKEWLYVPSQEDDSYVPQVAYFQENALRQNGIKVVGTIIAHEAPRLLAAPPEPDPWPERMMKIKSLGRMAVALVLAASTVAGLLGYMLLIGSVGLVDPAFIAVIETEDGQLVWLELCTWLA